MGKGGMTGDTYPQNLHHCAPDVCIRAQCRMTGQCTTPDHRWQVWCETEAVYWRARAVVWWGRLDQERRA